ncbi:MAG: hypothetical protein HRF49_06635 [bacterium]|jgi:hypothetical protein
MKLLSPKAASLAASLMFIFSATAPVAAKNPTAEELLSKVRHTLESSAYSCTIRIVKSRGSRGTKEVFQRIIHVPGKSLIQPQVRDAEGDLKDVDIYFIRVEDRRYLVDRSRKIAVNDPRGWGGIQEWINIGGRQAALLENATVSEGKYGSKRTWIVAIPGRMVRKVWISADSGFPLKLELLVDNRKLLTFEVLDDLKFIHVADIDNSLFDIPYGFENKSPLPSFRHDGAISAANAWRPLVPEFTKIPEGFAFEELIPHNLKHNLVFQMIFTGDDPSLVVSVFQTKNSELAKLLQDKHDKRPMVYAVKTTDGVVLIALGEFEAQFLQEFLDIFHRDDELADELVSASSVAYRHFGG